MSTTLVSESPETIYSPENLAFALSGQEKREDAVKVYCEAKEKATQILGADHPVTLRITHNLALEFNYLSRYRELDRSLEGSGRKK